MEIHDGPAAVALLDVLEGQAGDFVAAQAAAQHEGQDHAVAFALQVAGSGAAISCSACSLASQFPALMPSALAPRTRAIPAARSGASSALSVASRANLRMAARRTLACPWSAWLILWIPVAPRAGWC